MQQQQQQQLAAQRGYHIGKVLLSTVHPILPTTVVLIISIAVAALLWIYLIICYLDIDDTVNIVLAPGRGCVSTQLATRVTIVLHMRNTSARISLAVVLLCVAFCVPYALQLSSRESAISIVLTPRRVLARRIRYYVNADVISV